MADSCFSVKKITQRLGLKAYNQFYYKQAIKDTFNGFIYNT